jgi:phage shock protein E
MEEQTEQQPPIFIDVRTDEEWAAGHIDGALHFDLARLQQGELPDVPKNAAIGLYCRSGVRAGEALQILQENGFANVRNAGGFSALADQRMKTCGV